MTNALIGRFSGRTGDTLAGKPQGTHAVKCCDLAAMHGKHTPRLQKVRRSVGQSYEIHKIDRDEADR